MNEENARKREVLLTEDDSVLRQLMADVLEYDGYCVVQAPSSEAMRRAVRERRPFDLLITDIFMPGENGLHAIMALRRTGLQSRLLVVTSFPEAATQSSIARLGALLLAKPFTLGAFRSITKRLLFPNEAS